MASETKTGSVPAQTIVGAEQAEQFAERAAALLAELREKANQVTAERVELKADAGAQAALAAASHTCTTKVVFTGLLVWERVQVCCDSSPAVRATADIWGPTLAFGGIVWGSSTFAVAPGDLPRLGSLTMQVNIASVAVTISWWKDGTPVGAFVGGGVGIGAGVLGGSCTFENGSC